MRNRIRPDAAVHPGHAARSHGMGPVLAARERPHHLPGHAGRRHRRQPDHRPAADPRVGRSRQGHHHVRQLARRRDHRAVRDLRHDAVHQARRADDLHRAGRVGGRGAARVGRARASASSSRTPGCSSTSRTAARPGQAVDIEIQAKEIVRMRELLDEILAFHTGQPLDRVPKDTDRDFIMSGQRGQGLRHRRRGHHQP